MQADEDQEADESEADTVAEVAYNATAEVVRAGTSTSRSPPVGGPTHIQA
jgi:hypothetical protein